MSRRSRILAAGLAVTTAAALAGCGSSSPKSGATPTSVAAAAGEKAATGTPIKVGFINQGEGATPYPGTTAGTQAAVSYVNSQGGINGRPIDIIQCLDDGTASVTAGCASTLQSKGVSVVVNGANLSDAGADSIFTSANIPVIGSDAFTSNDLASKTSFWMFPVLDLDGGGIKLIESTFHANTIGYLAPDLAAEQVPQDLMAAEANALHVTFKTAKYELTSTDYSAQIAQLILAHPNVMLTFTTDAAAANIVQQFRSAGWTGPIVIGSSQAFLTATNHSAARDVYAYSDLYSWNSTTGVPARDVENLNVFRTAMQKYQPKTQLGTYAQVAFATVMDLGEVLSSLPTNSINSAAIMAAFRANQTYNKFMGTTFNCAANAESEVPGNCSAGIEFVYWNGSAWQQTLKFQTVSR
jgi:branched-chain amino acid transport system substrate-binding protein